MFGTSDGLTNIVIQEFMVSSNQCLYKNVYKIIIDFTKK